MLPAALLWPHHVPGTRRLKANFTWHKFMTFDFESLSRENFFISKSDEETGEFAH